VLTGTNAATEKRKGRSGGDGSLAMASHGSNGHGTQLGEREGGLPPASGHGKGREQGGGGSNGELELVHGRHVSDTRRPLRPKCEQLAGVDVVKVGAIFGPAMGRFGERALIEVC
jgi:hypothetical protein